MSKRITAILGLAAVGLLAGTVYVQAATKPAEEIAVAKQHAEFAVAADDLAAVHAHLHHVINCLVGPKDEYFDAKELNPCQDLGNGALTDLAVGDSRHAMLEKALESALIGFGTSVESWLIVAATDVIRTSDVGR